MAFIKRKPAKKGHNAKNNRKPINLVAYRPEYRLQSGEMVPISNLTPEQLESAPFQLLRTIDRKEQEIEYLKTILRYIAIESSMRNHTEITKPINTIDSLANHVNLD